MPPQPLRLTLLTAQDCHLCEHAREVLEHVAADGAVEVREVGWDTPEGTGLRTRQPSPFAPALYARGDLVGYGRLSERALRRRLRELLDA